jgi:hypothetical protein
VTWAGDFPGFCRRSHLLAVRARIPTFRWTHWAYLHSFSSSNDSVLDIVDIPKTPTDLIDVASKEGMREDAFYKEVLKFHRKGGSGCCRTMGM